MADLSPKEALEQLSAQLGLRYESQDWGIQNADATRLQEFMHFFETAPLSPTQRFEMGDLILASANAALIKQNLDHERLHSLEGFVARNREDLKPHFDYWAALGPEAEFPVASVLKTLTLTK